ncbi:MAG: hypothetical protein AAF363_22415 [Bacteroidota bacterium]
MTKKVLSFFLLTAFFVSCGGEKKFHKNPMDEIIRDMTAEKFTVILHDMEVEGSFFKTYRHQYKIITEKDSVPNEEITGWYEVSKELFQQHEQDMGMELAHKGEDGKLVKQVAPPGYSQYVGNERYGRWENRGGSSFWAFYGQYAFMSSMFNMAAYPARRSYYDGYRGAYGSGRPYYGPTTNGRRAYGTYSNYTSKARPNSRYARSSSFKNRVRSGTSRSSRSGSRYNSRSSSRSRGGGFGK